MSNSINKFDKSIGDMDPNPEEESDLRPISMLTSQNTQNNSYRASPIGIQRLEMSSKTKFSYIQAEASGEVVSSIITHGRNNAIERRTSFLQGITAEEDKTLFTYIHNNSSHLDKVMSLDSSPSYHTPRGLGLKKTTSHPNWRHMGGFFTQKMQIENARIYSQTLAKMKKAGKMLKQGTNNSNISNTSSDQERLVHSCSSLDLSYNREGGTLKIMGDLISNSNLQSQDRGHKCHSHSNSHSYQNSNISAEDVEKHSLYSGYFGHRGDNETSMLSLVGEMEKFDSPRSVSIIPFPDESERNTQVAPQRIEQKVNKLSLQNQALKNEVHDLHTLLKESSLNSRQQLATIGESVQQMKLNYEKEILLLKECMIKPTNIENNIETINSPQPEPEIIKVKPQEELRLELTPTPPLDGYIGHPRPTIKSDRGNKNIHNILQKINHGRNVGYNTERTAQATSSVPPAPRHPNNILIPIAIPPNNTHTKYKHRVGGQNASPRMRGGQGVRDKSESQTLFSFKDKYPVEGLPTDNVRNVIHSSKKMRNLRNLIMYNPKGMINSNNSPTNYPDQELPPEPLNPETNREIKNIKSIEDNSPKYQTERLNSPGRGSGNVFNIYTTKEDLRVLDISSQGDYIQVEDVPPNCIFNKHRKVNKKQSIDDEPFTFDSPGVNNMNMNMNKGNSGKYEIVNCRPIDTGGSNNSKHSLDVIKESGRGSRVGEEDTSYNNISMSNKPMNMDNNNNNNNISNSELNTNKADEDKKFQVVSVSPLPIEEKETVDLPLGGSHPPSFAFQAIGEGSNQGNNTGNNQGSNKGTGQVGNILQNNNHNDNHYVSQSGSGAAQNVVPQFQRGNQRGNQGKRGKSKGGCKCTCRII